MAEETKLCPCPREGVVTVAKADLGYRVSCSGCIASVTEAKEKDALAVWDRVSAREPKVCCLDPANSTVRPLATRDLIIKCGVCGSRRLPIGMVSALVQGDMRKECCAKPENLRRQQLRDDLMVNVCRVCNCRHFELSVEAGKLLSEVKPVA